MLNMVSPLERLKTLQNAPFMHSAKIVSEYDQEIPQSQTVDKPMAP